MKKYILHDLDLELEEKLLEKQKEATLISARKPYAKCKGCFGCWLKTPGKCVFTDGMEYLGANLLDADEIVIISENLYGGYSVPIKQLWDRCIGGVMPFFMKKNNELHHIPRYHSQPKLTVYFYNCEDLSPKERELSERLVAANAINFAACEYQVTFCGCTQDIMEVLG